MRQAEHGFEHGFTKESEGCALVGLQGEVKGRVGAWFQEGWGPPQGWVAWRRSGLGRRLGAHWDDGSPVLNN